ncbi:MAG TPA: acetoacetate--CoA ligase [candidate division Zixibacteria bacterium]|nr:acetoacetate--CoA ligase [candidate division Zixibacteria bacterium]MDD4916201.1 acetoacetate--CoA ligase [candidate division Zixibacteria bacterium]HOD66909.1 acetoacetate--CoA ligase [candidate division Zixibacteria bacterium]HPM37506.1 acetoacetate--CoA ligase [candidate division Zixibacteria bacterium]HQL23361.1 acetoacetate--CoA ligase [candidate division Zixibacteria bacterium]
MTAPAPSPLWVPPPSRVERSHLSRFMCFLGRRARREFFSYDDLWQFSVDHIASFWEAVWDFAGIIHSQPWEAVVEGDRIDNAVWFRGTRLNFAENLLRYRDRRTAIISECELGTVETITYADLYGRVARCAAGLKKMGVGPGDRVAAFIPNIPEAVVAMLAATSLGAVWSSCSPDFGLQGVLDRFGQIEPKVLITADGYQYNGRRYDSLATVARVLEHLPGAARAVVIPRLGPFDPAALPNSLAWAELLANDAAEIEFRQLPFDHPVYIVYSSGTTGPPKGLVHGAGGTLLQHYKEHVLHTDLGRDDVITYYTTCGWMMWNWLASALQVGATLYLYQGSPSYPDLTRLWCAAERRGITVFGTSPKFLAACEQAGLAPGKMFDLAPLRTILSTGAPLSPRSFAWVYENVKRDLQLASISGGTDILSCFMLGCPLLPVYPGEIQCRGLGMKVETCDDRGRPVAGAVGELVCTERFPSRPVSFWNDPDGSKYRRAYFAHFPGVWRHGDFVEITPRGGVIVHGRSDATLNPGGVRIGTAEIYAPVEALPEVVDSLAVGQRWRGDTRIILFVRLAPGVALTDDLRGRIGAAIREARTPRHVPAKIIAVDDIPRTRNGKKVEVVVTRLIHGLDVPGRAALANPEALDLFRRLPELDRP